MRNGTSDLRIPLSDALPLSHRDSMVSEVSCEVSFDFGLVTSVGQGKLLSPHEEWNLRPSDSTLRCSTTESQRLHGKRSLLRSKFWFWSCDERGTRKTSESPWGMEPQTFGFRSPMLYHWATETPWWVKTLTKVIWYASCILWGLAKSIA